MLPHTFPRQPPNRLALHVRACHAVGTRPLGRSLAASLPQKLVISTSLRGHAAPISDCLLVAAAAARPIAASSSVDGAVKLWDATGAMLASPLPSVEAEPQPLPMTSRDDHLYCCRGHELLVVNLGAEAVSSRVPLPAEGAPLHIACDVQGRLLATSCLCAGTVQLWDMRLFPAAAAEVQVPSRASVLDSSDEAAGSKKRQG